MACCNTSIKYLLFIFNLVFALSGLAIIIVGGVLLANGSDMADLLEDVQTELKAPQIVLIVVGVIIFVIAFLGCCGAVKESRCMLITFAVLLLSIFIIELAIGIYAVVNFDDFKKEIHDVLSNKFDEIQSNEEVREMFDNIQKSFECCGIDGKGNYETIPDSCCVNFGDGCASSNQFWDVGCAEALTSFTSDAGKIMGGVAIAVSLIEVVGAIFALKLASSSH